MATLRGSLQRWALAPSLRHVSFEGRGFPVPTSAATRQLEAVPQAVACGFDWALDPGDSWSLERRLDLVRPALRGFAYEGATMAFTVLDVTCGGTRTRDLLRGHGAPHLLLAYIGIGFAMARLPRVLWRRALPDLQGTPYHPTLSWLAVDGYGFDLAYFDPGRWVDRQERPRPYPWLGRPDYFPRAVDQGIGRALWFLHGGQPSEVSASVARFAPERQADLWSGVGLAAAFAGGAGDGGLAALVEAAEGHRSQLAVGAVFAVKARTLAGHVPAPTADAARLLCGLDPAAADRLADQARQAPSPDAEGEAASSGSPPPYEAWRERIRRRVPVAGSPHRDRGAGRRRGRQEERGRRSRGTTGDLRPAPDPRSRTSPPAPVP